MRTVVDAVLAVIVLFFLISGIRRGLIRQVMEVVGIIAGFIGAFYLAHRFAAFLEPRLDISYEVSLVIAAVLLFAGIIIGVHFIALGASKVLKMTPLGGFDKILGGVLGAVKGLLLCSLLLIILLSLPLPEGLRDELEDDPAVIYVEPILPVLFDTIVSLGSENLDFDSIMRKQGDIEEKAEDSIKEIKDRIEEKKKKVIDSAALPSAFHLPS